MNNDVQTDVPGIDPQKFRETLGHYPTGVVVIAALNEEGQPEGLVIGSFVSVSLDPPLVAFLPMKSSFTYGRIRNSEIFSVNILAHDQLDLCRLMARGGPEKFEHVAWRPSPNGAPILDGAVAWIECRRGQEVDAGDHYITLGEVLALNVERPVLPLLFFQGGYGRFTSSSMQLGDMSGNFGGFAASKRLLDSLDRVASELTCEAHLVARQGDDVVLAALSTEGPRSSYSFIGARVPLTPPMGTAFIAFEDEAEEATWYARLGRIDEAAKQSYQERLERVRKRGFSVVLKAENPEGGPDAFEGYSRPDRTPSDERRFRGLLAEMVAYHEPELADDEIYDVRWVEVPVCQGNAPVRYSIRLEGFPEKATGATIREWAAFAKVVAQVAATELASTES